MAARDLQGALQHCEENTRRERSLQECGRGAITTGTNRSVDGEINRSADYFLALVADHLL